MSAPYVVKTRNGHYYRRGRFGSPHWITVFRDATRFVNFETAEQLAKENAALGCYVASAAGHQLELSL
jgi:hypothetical protein